MDQTTVSETGEWARTIIEVYMIWFTFFLCSNMLAMAWVCGRKIEDGARQMLRPVCILFFVLNILGTISTAVVGRTVGPMVPEFSALIGWAAFANGLGLVGFGLVWLLCRRRLTVTLPVAEL
jgi:hypothetical protein